MIYTVSQKKQDSTGVDNFAKY